MTCTVLCENTVIESSIWPGHSIFSDLLSYMTNAIHCIHDTICEPLVNNFLVPGYVTWGVSLHQSHTFSSSPAFPFLGVWEAGSWLLIWNQPHPQKAVRNETHFCQMSPESFRDRDPNTLSASDAHSTQNLFNKRYTPQQSASVSS